MKKILLFIAIASLSSCKISHYNIEKLQTKYEKKMSKDKQDKIKIVSTGKKMYVNRQDLYKNIKIYFNEKEIEGSYKTISMTSWNPVNLRILVPPFVLTLFTRSHVYNQALRQAAMACAEAEGDGILFTNTPLSFQIIKFDNRQNAIKIPMNKLDKKSFEKNKEKELEKEKKRAARKNKKTIFSKLKKLIKKN